MQNNNAPCPQFLRTDRSDGSSEILTLVRITDGHLTNYNFACVDLDSVSYPYLVQITTGTETGDDFVGLYDLDGDKIDVGNCSWEMVTEAPIEVINQIEHGWENGLSVVERIVK